MTCPTVVGPCWPDLDWSCCGCADDATDDQKTRAAAVAARILWGLSGRQFSCCVKVLRPCRQPDLSPPYWRREWGGSGWFPFVGSDGEWRNCLSGTNCGLCQGCCRTDEIELRDPLPISEVTEVKVDGVVVDSSKYRLADYRRLIRLDGIRWPDCQDFGLPDTLAGTFAVSVRAGLPLDAAGQGAYETYACELLRACIPGGDTACSLPQNTVRVTRDNVSVELLNPLDHLNQGRVGLPAVDQWLRAVNPSITVASSSGARALTGAPMTSPPLVMSPDMMYDRT